MSNKSKKRGSKLRTTNKHYKNNRNNSNNIKSKNKRNKINRNNKTANKPRVNIMNTGAINTVTMINNKTTQQGFDWDAKYDGKQLEFHGKLNKDGTTEVIDKTLNNAEIEQLLGYSPVNDTLENRLEKDWALNKNMDKNMDKNMNKNMNKNMDVPVIMDDNNLLFLDRPSTPNTRHFIIQI